MKYPEAQYSETEYLYTFHPRAQKKVYMAPDKFLSLTIHVEDDFEHDYSQERIQKLKDKMTSGKGIDPMLMYVDYDTGKVLQHEGRHRSFASKELGITKVPVILYFKKKDAFGKYVFMDEQWPPINNIQFNKTLTSQY